MHDYNAAASFLDALTGATDAPVLFATFADKKAPGTPSHARHFFGRLSELWPVLVQENTQGRGVFHTVNVTRGDTRRASDILAVRAAFIDNDAGHLPAPEGCHLRPSMVVDSGRGRHTYWVLSDGQSPSEWSSVQRRLAAHYGTDAAVCDLPRVMRTPGFFHHKGAPVLVTWTDTDPSGDAVYTLDTVAAGLPPDPKASAKAPGPVGYSLPSPGSRSITIDDVKKLKKSPKTPEWSIPILDAIIDGTRPTIDPVTNAGKVDDTLIRFLTWFAGRIPDAGVDSIVAVLAPSWTMLQAADTAAGRPAYTMDDLARKAASALRFVHESRAAEIESHPFLEYVARDENGHIIPSRANVELIFRHHPEWSGVLAFDDRARRLVYRRSAPWLGASWAPSGKGGTEGPPGTEGQPIADSHTGLFAHWLAAAPHVHLTRIPTTTIVEAIEAVCAENTFDPFREWLEAQEWDGTPRLARWLVDYLGAPDDEWSRSVGPRWLMAAVARTLYPGCKVDEMLILEGRQGVRKSSALRALAGPDFFTDSLPRGGDPTDTATALSGPVIVEIPEVDGVSRRKEASEIKAFLSKQTDRYRPKYGRREIEVPRRCVFAGSTNEDDYLVDQTGGRRFWPVRVAITRAVLDVDGLERDRGQLWGEALAMVRVGLPWYLPHEEAQEGAVRVAERTEGDPWDTVVERYCRSGAAATVVAGVGVEVAPDGGPLRPEVRLEDVLAAALQLDRGRWTTHDARRAGGCLRRLGYRRTKSDGRMVWRLE